MWERDKDNLVICVALSVALHLLAFVFVAVLGGSQLLAAMFQAKEPPEEREPAPTLVLLESQPKMPGIAQEVDDAQASETAPTRNTPFIATRNALAQDQSSRTDSKVPEIKGQEKEFLETTTAIGGKVVPAKPPTPKPLDPARERPQPEKPKPAPKPVEKARPSPSQDDLTKKEYALLKPKAIEATPAQPDDVPVEAQQAEPMETTTPEQARAPPAVSPRPERILTSKASDITGGVDRKGAVAFDTRAIASGNYDRILYQSIGQRWRLMLEDRYLNQGGTVKVRFDLLVDGQITNVIVIDSGGVGPVLVSHCRQAIIDSNPYRPIPDDLRALAGDTRQYTIYFQYSFR